MSSDGTRGRGPLLAFILALAILLPGASPFAHAQEAAGTQQRPRRAAAEEVGEGEVVRVETRLVSVPVLVTDREGRALKGLTASDFLLLEDGRPQQIANFSTTEAPFEVALLLDTSGSTRAEVGLIRRAALDFIGALRPGDRVAVLSFASRGGEQSAAAEIEAPLTDDREELREAVEAVGDSNGTPFYDGLEKVARVVFRERPGEEAGGRRALVALTDGVDSASESDFEAARAALKRAGVVAYFIQVNTEDYVEESLARGCEGGGLRLSRAQLRRYRRLVAPDSDSDDDEVSNFCRMGPFERMQVNRTLYDLARREMETLARESGGRNFPVASLRDARGAFRQVAEELGTQYSLGYYPTNKARDGAFRAISVRVRGARDARVRAREGYRAPKGSGGGEG